MRILLWSVGGKSACITLRFLDMLYVLFSFYLLKYINEGADDDD